MSRYDYGLRGPRDTMDPRGSWWGALSYDSDFGPRPRGPMPNRVTARYNMDYVRDRGPVYPRNPNAYGGEWEGQVGGEQAYHSPYQTRGGTRTHRGVPRPLRYDYRDFGPDYGGRYPDEI
jgi:hypothetical protein